VGLANARGSRIAARMYFILLLSGGVVAVLGVGVSLDIRESERVMIQKDGGMIRDDVLATLLPYPAGDGASG
jgi:hypothetical protein